MSTLMQSIITRYIIELNRRMLSQTLYFIFCSVDDIDLLNRDKGTLRLFKCSITRICFPFSGNFTLIKYKYNGVTDSYSKYNYYTEMT